MEHQKLVEGIKTDLNSITVRRYTVREQAVLYQLGLCMGFIASEMRRDTLVYERWNRMYERIRQRPGP